MPTWSAPKERVSHISYMSAITSSSSLYVSNCFSLLFDNCFEVLVERTQQGPITKEFTPSKFNSQPDHEHVVMHFSACYDNDCNIPRSAKKSCSSRGWFTRKPRHYNPEPVIDKTRQQMISTVSLYTTTSKPALKVKILGENGKMPTRGSD